MKILAIADEEDKRYYDFFRPGCLDGIDMIISCGDLSPRYLEFLVTMGHAPVFYVHGNHDEQYLTRPPEGCICLDDKLVVHNGLRIVGLGGSYRYRDGTFMYTEHQMMQRVVRLLPQIIAHGGFDILVTHAPAKDLNDLDTIPHRGFLSFRWLMLRFHPKYFLHGHVHLSYNFLLPRWCRWHRTQIINAYESYVFDYKG